MFRPRTVILILAIGIICGAYFFLSGLLKENYVPPILMYHSINPTPNPWIKSLIVSPDNFERQMRFLKEQRYNVLPLAELARLIKEKQKLPPKAIAITFDDGYKDNYTYAFPVLKKYNFPATIFIIINEVGRPSLPWPGDDRLNWEQIRKMRDSGLISFGSHTLGPDPLTKIQSEEEVIRQVFASKRELERELGLPVVAFSYPEGRFTPEIRQMVIDARYSFAVATMPGKSFSKDDVFALKRVRIAPSSNNLLVFWFESTGYYPFFKEKKKKK